MMQHGYAWCVVNRNDFQFAVITEAGIGENLTENGGSDLLLFIGGELGVVLFVVPVPAEMELINRRVRHAGGHIGYLEAVFQGGVFCIHMDIIRHRGWDRFPGEGKLQQGQGIDFTAGSNIAHASVPHHSKPNAIEIKSFRENRSILRGVPCQSTVSSGAR